MSQQLLLINPKKRRKAKRKKVRTVSRKKITRRRKRNPVMARKRRRIRKRNPSARGILNAQVIPAATAAAGAIGLDALLGVLPVPAMFQTGSMRYLLKGAGAIGLGLLAGTVVKQNTAKELSMGALTVTMHEVYRDLMSKFAPQIPLAGYDSSVMGYYNAGYPVNGLGYYGGAGSAIPTVGANINAPGLSPPCPTAELSGVSMYEEDWEN